MSTLKKMDECNPSKYQFEKLSLIEDVDVSVYEEAIDFAFADPDIRNIAISGAYGSGKSSVLASYKKKRPHKNFMHISLTHFVPEKKQETSYETEIIKPSCQQKLNNRCNVGHVSIPAHKTDIAALEGKILNQLIHQLDARNIPQTNFRIKNTASVGSIIWHTVAFTALIVCFLHVILSSTWIDFVGTFEASCLRNFLEIFTTPISFLLSGLMVFVICALYIYSAVKAQRYNAAIRKLSLQGNEIELFEENNDSFFDKYLNEVLYLFENSGIDAIVFEDMDRYEMEVIFERLREVNTLVNIRLAQKKKQIIRFVFLLRDDIFISKDRTKFFDFIIPIVPVIDSSNSYDQLIEHLDRNNIRSEFSDEFLQGVSLYIDDMRLLKNICNEYLIYHSRLDSINLDSEKLLALITYKNIYPRDFGRLQNNLGYVHAVFNAKTEILKSQLSNLEDEKKRLSKLEQTAAEDALKSKIEIMRAYAVVYLSDYTTNLKRKDESSLDAELRKSLSGTKLKEYEDRIELASSQKQAEIRQSRKEVERKMLSIKGMRLHEIIPHEDGANVLSGITRFEEGSKQDYKEMKESQYFDLLKYLILNGYLDESYPDYMTYFYPNSLTRQDKIFLRRVLDRKGHDYTYCLDNPDLVVSKLRVSDFDYVEVLNNSLVNHLLQDNSHTEKLQHLLAQLEKNQNFEFISQYLELTTEKEKFVQAINKQWPGFFGEIVRQRKLKPLEIRQYSIDTLYYSDNEQLVGVNMGGCLTEYISNSSDYLQIIEPRIEKLVSAFTLLGVRFQSIDIHLSDIKLFRRVYQESLYSINMENVLMMLVAVHGLDDNKDKLLRSNYSYLCRFPESPLYQYIESHMDDYMSMWLIAHQGAIEDQESCAIKLINHPNVSDRFKEGYIEKLKTVISCIQEIWDKKLWEKLLERKRISHTEENILAYWSTQSKLDTVAICYVNEFSRKIDFSRCLETTSESTLKDFFIYLVKCNDINSKQYEECVTSLGFKWGEEFNVAGLSIDKVKILAKNHILQMTPATLRFLRSNYADAIHTYIQSGFDEYIDILTTQLMDQNELLMILEWDIPEETKKKLIDMAPSSISIIGKKYSSETCEYILQKKPHANDIPQLYASYDIQPDLIKDYMYSHAIKNIDAIIRGATRTTTELKHRLLSDNQIAATVKHRLLVSVIKTLSQAEVALCLDAAKKHECSKIFNPRARPRIENDAQNKEILENFKTRGWITNYCLSETGDEYEIQRPTSPKKRALTHA